MALIAAVAFTSGQALAESTQIPKAPANPAKAPAPSGVKAKAPAPTPDPAEPAPIPVQRTLVAKDTLFPVALRLQDGRIAAVVRSPANHLGLDGRLDIIFSSDEGQTWSQPTVVVDTEIDDRDPAFGQAKDGTLVIGYYRDANYNDQGKYDRLLDRPHDTWVTLSPDGGKTWQKPLPIDVSEIGWGSPYGRISTQPDGSMLMPIYGLEVRPSGQKSPPRPDGAPGDQNHSYLFRSTDNGKSWKRWSEVGDGKLQLNETAILRLPDGKIIAAVRSRTRDLLRTDSTDEGRTWSKPRPLAPINVHPADLVLLDDGRILLTIGYRIRPLCGVVGMVSDAQGEFKWEKHFVLMNDAYSGDCGYPSTVLLKDGRAMTLYYATLLKGEPKWSTHCGALTYRVPGNPP